MTGGAWRYGGAGEYSAAPRRRAGGVGGAGGAGGLWRRRAGGAGCTAVAGFGREPIEWTGPSLEGPGFFVAGGVRWRTGGRHPAPESRAAGQSGATRVKNRALSPGGTQRTCRGGGVPHVPASKSVTARVDIAGLVKVRHHVPAGRLVRRTELSAAARPVSCVASSGLGFRPAPRRAGTQDRRQTAEERPRAKSRRPRPSRPQPRRMFDPGTRWVTVPDSTNGNRASSSAIGFGTPASRSTTRLAERSTAVHQRAPASPSVDAIHPGVRVMVMSAGEPNELRGVAGFAARSRGHRDPGWRDPAPRSSSGMASWRASRHRQMSKVSAVCRSRTRDGLLVKGPPGVQLGARNSRSATGSGICAACSANR